MKVPDSNKIVSIAMLIGLVIVLFIVYKIMSSVGLIKTSKSKKEDIKEEQAKEQIISADIFRPGFFHDKIGSYKSIGSGMAYAYADQLHGALKGAGTNEDLIFSIFLKLYNKINVSEIATTYAITYKSNLGLDLADDLSKSEMVRLMDIINKLPNK